MKLSIRDQEWANPITPLCVVVDEDKGPCKSLGIYDHGRFCGWHWSLLPESVLQNSKKSPETRENTDEFGAVQWTL